MKRALFVLVLVAAAIAIFVVTAQVRGPEVSGATLGGVSLKLEYATTEAAREQGLGNRVSLMWNEGMLFVFPKDDYYGFWMKDTLIPLDMFWLNDKGQVVFIERNVLPSTYPDVFYPSAPARYVLETAAGFADAHGIAPGAKLKLLNVPIVSQ